MPEVIVTDPDKSRPAPSPDVIDRLYETATDPERYEELLDRWEELIAPERVRIANRSDAPGLATRAYDSHFRRADQLLDRVINEAPSEGPVEMIARIERTAAFALDRNLTVIAVNAGAASALGISVGAKLSDLALAEGEAGGLGPLAFRTLQGNTSEPVLVRARSARAGHIVLLHLRLIRPPQSPPFLIVLTSEFGWPEGFGAILRAAFDLTEAEVENLRALAEGKSLAEIAEARGRSLETVRAQIKSVMSKTETRSQSDLVRLTLSTMDLTRFSQEQTARAAQVGGAAFGTLEERPVQAMTLPDGRRLTYLVLGDPGGRPVLFLPLDFGLVRWPGPAEAEAARRGICVIVPIRPGYGTSDPIPKAVPSYMAQLARDIAALLDHLRLTSVPVLSLGSDAYIAYAMQATVPGRISAFIACAGILPLTRPQQYDRMDKWQRFINASARYTPHLLPFMVKAGFAMARRIGKRGFVQAIYGNSPADVRTFAIPEVFEAMISGSEVALSATHSAHDAFSRELVEHETGDWRPRVEAMRGVFPVHFLNGLQDPEVPAQTLAEHQADYDWIDFRTYPDAGQLLFFLKWRDVLHLVESYLPPAKR